jgi:hypothetical protein
VVEEMDIKPLMQGRLMRGGHQNQNQKQSQQQAAPQTVQVQLAVVAYTPLARSRDEHVTAGAHRDDDAGAVGVDRCLPGSCGLMWLFAGPPAPDGKVEPLEVTIPDVGGIAQGSGDHFPMMLEQPLFWAERAPSLAQEGGKESAATIAGPDGLVYLGVLVNEPSRQVLLRDGEQRARAARR